MRTIDSAGAGASGSRWRRDARLLLRLMRLVWGHLVTGAAIRRAYRERERRGETYWVDDPPKAAR